MTMLILSPFSNSEIRDWPMVHFAELIRLVHESRPEVEIRVFGTASQRLRANEIVRTFDAAHVFNDCGRMLWDEAVGLIRSAACVVGNNSGIAHLAAGLGVPTVCVFGGSHQRLEWHPSGPHTTILSRVIACSPCHLDHNMGCPYDKACLRQIAPVDVAAAALGYLNSAPADRRADRMESAM